MTPLVVRRLGENDRNAFVTSVVASRDLHAGWYAAPETSDDFRDLLSRSDGRNHISYVFALAGTDQLTGTATIGNIVRGSFESGYLSYAAFIPFGGRGLMAAGLRGVIDDCFGSVGLHRLEANVQPENGSSIALLRRLGFRCEGHSPRYLRIAGRWRDHERYALTCEEWGTGCVSSPDQPG